MKNVILTILLIAIAAAAIYSIVTGEGLRWCVAGLLGWYLSDAKEMIIQMWSA